MQEQADAPTAAHAPINRGEGRPVPYWTPGSGWGAAVRRWAGEFWLWYLFWNSRHFPWYARVTKHFFLWGAWKFSPGLRAPTLTNAARILGPDSTPAQREALAKSVLSNFYDFVEDIGSNLHKTNQQMIASVEEIVGRDRYARARALRRGAIIITAHLGSFEIGTAALRQMEPKVHVVFHRDSRPLFETMRSRLHDRLGLIEAPVEKGLEMWMSLRDALARDEVVMLQADRVMPGQTGHRVEFLGGHVLLPPGPIKLAAATGSPLIPVFTLRAGPGRVRVVVEEPIFCDRVRIGGDASTPPELLAVARVLEKYVRAYPEQWLMLQPACCEDLDRGGLEFPS